MQAKYTIANKQMLCLDMHRSWLPIVPKQNYAFHQWMKLVCVCRRIPLKAFDANKFDELKGYCFCLYGCSYQVTNI